MGVAPSLRRPAPRFAPAVSARYAFRRAQLREKTCGRRAHCISDSEYDHTELAHNAVSGSTKESGPAEEFHHPGSHRRETIANNGDAVSPRWPNRSTGIRCDGVSPSSGNYAAAMPGSSVSTALPVPYYCSCSSSASRPTGWPTTMKESASGSSSLLAARAMSSRVTSSMKPLRLLI